MGKKVNQKELVSCIYCGFKGNAQELKDREYIFETTVGIILECPRCNSQQKLG